MNDFTKEELQDMINWGEVYTEFGNGWTDKMHRPIINKLQSLINNYCEHTNSNISFTCDDCGRIE
jgi:hypothetical protein